MKAIDKLRVWWFKRERDMGGWHPLGSQTVCDLSYLLYALKPIFAELDRRGYDLTTFKLSIEPKRDSDRFASNRQPEDDARTP